MKPLEPVLVTELLPGERTALLELLGGLSAAEWDKSTVCPGWSVKDIAVHLLGDDMGLISRERDGYAPEVAVGISDKGIDWPSFVNWINQRNAIWVQANRRLSPQMLCQLLEFSGRETFDYFSGLDMFAPSGPIGWAGSEPDPKWLHVAREYTERWIHQQQIRDALGKPGLKEARWFRPLLETFMRALPQTFVEVETAPQTTVALRVTGDAGGEWFVVKKQVAGWGLWQEVELAPVATVTLDQETTWRLFTKGISKEEAEKTVTIEGDPVLGRKVLDTVSIIA